MFKRFIVCFRLSKEKNLFIPIVKHCEISILFNTTPSWTLDPVADAWFWCASRACACAPRCIRIGHTCDGNLDVCFSRGTLGLTWKTWYTRTRNISALPSIHRDAYGSCASLGYRLATFHIHTCHIVFSPFFDNSSLALADLLTRIDIFRFKEWKMKKQTGCGFKNQ